MIEILVSPSLDRSYVKITVFDDGKNKGDITLDREQMKDVHRRLGEELGEDVENDSRC